jgi:prephenate dehydratase
MKKLAFLGPTHTFSEIFYRKYYNNIYTPLYVKTIQEAFASVDVDTDALIPIENISDGFVGFTIDAFIDYDLYIIHDASLPVQFSCTGNLNTSKDIYVQFKVQGQCLNFLKTIPHLNVILTASNYDSYVLAKQHHQCAIIPKDVLDSDETFHIDDIEDLSHNTTRFVTVSKKPKTTGLKSACIITPIKDRPGLLYEVLSFFNQHHINLTNIMSRPKKTVDKGYHFYIEFELNIDQEDTLFKVINMLNTSFEVKWLGRY